MLLNEKQLRILVQKLIESEKAEFGVIDMDPAAIGLDVVKSDDEDPQGTNLDIEALPAQVGRTDKFVFKSVPCTTALAVAKKEGNIWDSQKLGEKDPEAYPYLKKYWDAVGWREGKWSPTGTPWSAAFVSWVMQHENVNGPKWDSSAAHRRYLDDNCWPRRKKVDANPDNFKGQVLYLAFSGNEIIGNGKQSPRGKGELAGNDLFQPGDVIGARKDDGIKIHMDVYVGNDKKVGGNTNGGTQSFSETGGTSGLQRAKTDKTTDVIKRVEILGSVSSFVEQQNTNESMQKKTLLNEKQLRILVQKLIESEKAQFGVIDMDPAAIGLGRRTKGTKSSEKAGSINVTDPVTIKGGNYPQKNVRYVEAAMTEKGITNRYVRIGILCTIAKESNFTPKSEKTYQGTPLSRIYEIWPKLRKLGDDKVNALKKSTSPSDGHNKVGLGFFDYMYGGKYGNGPRESGDGSRYRGRGFNQVTFKGTYKKYARLSGTDILNNPDKLNEPETAAKVAVAFLANRLKSAHGTFNPDAKSIEEGIKFAAEANCKSPGSTKDCSRAIASATKRLPHFLYEGGASSSSSPGAGTSSNVSNNASVKYGADASINYDAAAGWKEKTLFGVIARGGKSKKFGHLLALDGGTVGIAHFAAGGMNALYEEMGDDITKKYFNKTVSELKAIDCRGSTPSGKNDNGSGCYKKSWWREGMKNFLQDSKSKQIQINAWNKSKGIPAYEHVKNLEGWNTERSWAIAAGIANSVGIGGMKKIVKGRSPEEALIKYVGNNSHRKRRAKAINQVFPIG